MKVTTPFEEYYQMYYQQVYLYTVKKISDSFEAENLTMDAFYQCLKNFDSFDSEKASFKTWIFTVVNNRIKNYYRDKKGWDDIDNVVISVADTTRQADRRDAVQCLRDDLAVALQQLNDVQKQIVVYRFYKDMNAVEIGEILGMQPNNVRVHLSRALAKLRTYFEENNIEWESVYG